MIAYFDTSALIPLLVEEPGSEIATRLWDSADHVVSVRLVYAEGRAALAQARRLDRITARQLRRLVDDFDGLYHQLDLVEVDDPLVRRAGALAQRFSLRGYDALHLAGSERVKGDETVLVAGDAQLCDAAAELGMAVAVTDQPSH